MPEYLYGDAIHSRIVENTENREVKRPRTSIAFELYAEDGKEGKRHLQEDVDKLFGDFSDDGAGDTYRARYP